MQELFSLTLHAFDFVPSATKQQLVPEQLFIAPVVQVSDDDTEQVLLPLSPREVHAFEADAPVQLLDLSQLHVFPTVPWQMFVDPSEQEFVPSPSHVLDLLH